MIKTTLLASMLVASAAFAGSAVQFDCKLSRIGANAPALKGNVRLLADEAIDSACVWDGSVGMEFCFSGELGNIVVKSYDLHSKKLLSSVVSKYGSVAQIPNHFQIDVEVPSADEGEGTLMFISECRLSR